MIQPDFVNWAARRAEWNLQPRFYETEAGSKKIIAALKAIGQVAMAFALMAAPYSFTATLVFGLTSVVAFAVMVKFNRISHFWNDPDYCEAIGRKVLQNAFVNIRINSSRNWDNLLAAIIIENASLIEKGIVREDDFMEIKRRCLSEN